MASTATDINNSPTMPASCHSSLRIYKTTTDIARPNAVTTPATAIASLSSLFIIALRSQYGHSLPIDRDTWFGLEKTSYSVTCPC